MTIYKFPEEKEYALHYAKRMGDAVAVQILETGEVSTKEEAKHLSQFFYDHVVSTKVGDCDFIKEIFIFTRYFADGFGVWHACRLQWLQG